MKHILVSGLINIETSVAIKNFPVEYYPIDYNFNGIQTTVSGVAYNVVTALKTLGAEPYLMSVIGRDIYHSVITNELKAKNINSSLYPIIDNTPQSVILYDEEGKRRICLDLKNIQDMKYPIDTIPLDLGKIDMAIICNINFSRDLLKIVREKQIPIATDVHVIDRVDDSFNRDFMEFANILFLSNEHIMGKEKEFLQELVQTFNNEIIVIGMGSQGALMYERRGNLTTHYPACRTRDIISTVGAGDALFSSFIYFYTKTGDPYVSIKNAIFFASYKIGEKGAANGFLTEKELELVVRTIR